VNPEFLSAIALDYLILSYLQVTKMNFYTVVLRQSSGYWVALCLENGIVGQGNTQEDAIHKLKEAIESFEMVYESESNIYKSPIPIQQLHEFLYVEAKEQDSEIYELSKVYA
jgi:predicted RNase H-like HicB family nuclease